MGEMIPDGYRIMVNYDTNKKQFTATVPELGRVMATGETRADALEKAEEAIESAIRKAAEDEQTLPEPVDRSTYSGELTIKVSPSLHRELAFLAVEDGLEPMQLAAELVTTGISVKTAGRLRPAKGGDRQNRKDNRRSGRSHKKDYHNIMDDRASFIEYVRNIGTGGGKRSGGGGGGGGGGSGGGGGGGRSRSRGRRK